MESLLILIAIVVIDALIKRANAKKKAQQQPPPWQAPEDDSSQELEEATRDEEFDERTDEESPPREPRPFAARKLQEYIKQFEEAQREASQGTLEPATPPPVKFNQKDPYLPHSLRELAEEVILSDVIDAEYLMEEFEMTEGEAISTLNELEKLRVIGRDMGNGEHDVLVHDVSELNNLFKREQKDTVRKPEPSAATSQASATDSASSSKQNQLKILEERARKAREEAAAASRQSDLENGYSGEASEIEDPFGKRPAIRTINRDSVRRGFIWGKIIDEPRFKKRWTALSR